MAGWTIVVPNQEIARMSEIVYGQPDPLLAGRVLTYTAHDLTHTQPVSWQIAPLGAVTVSFEFETAACEAGSPLPAAMVSGMRDRPMVIEQPRGTTRGLTVALSPAGAYAFFRQPLRELTNTNVDLAALIGTRAGLLLEQLAETPTWAGRFRLLDAQLKAGFRDCPELARPVHGALHRLTTSAGRVSVTALAGEVGWTRQHLATRFRQQVGLSPKTVARVARVQRATAMMTQPSPLPWSQIALACGYADQAHLNRDFRALTGCTPTDYLPVDAPQFTPAHDDE
jgi:AraC-like DNA-binding protein